MKARLDALTEALAHHEEIEVAWVYGSVARDEASASSDIDVAVAFRAPSAEPWERVDGLRSDLQAQVDRQVSVLDLNRAPTPLSYEVIRDGRVQLSRSDLRLRSEEARVWSLWEEYRAQQNEPERPPEAYVLAIREQVAQHVASLEDCASACERAPCRSSSAPRPNAACRSSSRPPSAARSICCAHWIVRYRPKRASRSSACTRQRASINPRSRKCAAPSACAMRSSTTT